MNIYPALDLRGGKVVRLQQGDPDRQTTYSDNPLVIAHRWLGLGARWLHVVNLDGTLLEANDNETFVRAICGIAAERGASVQFGGGLRTAADIERAFRMGVNRVVLGTLIIDKPELAGDLAAEYGSDRIAVALDARDGFIMSHGWQRQTAFSPTTLGKQFKAMNIQHALYTDITRDGELVGVNIDATAALARETGLRVIASGGLSNLADLKAIKATGVIAGAVLGKALYENTIELKEALAVVSEMAS